MDSPQYVDSDVAARLDRLPWSKWHWLIVTALGVTWILDGLEATLGSALGGILKDPHNSTKFPLRPSACICSLSPLATC